jgi:hypothetical protein
VNRRGALEEVKILKELDHVCATQFLKVKYIFQKFIFEMPFFVCYFSP